MIVDRMAEENFTKEELVTAIGDTLDRLLYLTEKGMVLQKDSVNKKFFEDSMKPVYESYQKNLQEIIKKYGD